MEKLQLGRNRKTDAEKPRMDPLMRALKALHSAGSPEAMTPEELEHQRRNQEILGRLTAPMAGMEYEELSIGTMPAAWTRLKAPHGDRRVILYCHGGGYTSGNLGYSRVLSSKLAHVTGYDVLSFEYRLAPEYIEAVRRAYAGDRDLHDPDLSPLLGDLGSFPPTLIQVGDHEILYSDSASLAAALRAAHVPCRLEVSEGMWHVFQMFPIKKAAAAMESAARFLLEL